MFDKNFNSKKILRNKRDLLLQHGAGIMFRTKFLKSIKGYNEKIKNCEDFDLIIRIEKNMVEGFICLYHITNISNNLQNI